MVKQVTDIKSRKACFSTEGSMGGWVIPISKMMENWNQQSGTKFGRFRRQTYNPKDEFRYTCPSDYNVIYDLFAQSCAPGKWWNDEKFSTKNKKLPPKPTLMINSANP